MSVIVTGSLARYRRMKSDGALIWLWQCPGCGQWGHLDDDQWHGRVSVDHASMGCPAAYHETHDYAADLAAHESEAVTE